MSRRSGAAASGAMGSGGHAPTRTGLGTRNFPPTAVSNLYGLHGTPSPEGMRQLTAAEKAHNVVWTWDPDLGTYVSDEFPQGIA
ncbi:MAG TPA: hypothetical protein VNL94_06750 [Candidatus Binatia bacterium]|nr:hypothetical protein [Candidatus Binatia bacterium]